MGENHSDARPITANIEQDGTTAVIKDWLKKSGDIVEENEPVAELETDKVVVEVSAPWAGELEIVAQPGDEIEPGAVLGYVYPLQAGGQTPTPEDEPADEPTDSGARSVPVTSPAPEPFAREMRLSPSVRQLLRKYDLDPARLTGSGRRGGLTRADVVAVIEAGDNGDDRSAAPKADRPDSPMPPQQIQSAQNMETGRAFRDLPHDRTRHQIAEHMQASVTQAPHVTAVFEADFSAVATDRAANHDEFSEQGVRLTYTAYLVAASVAAMQAAPIVNSRWHEEAARVFPDINIGIDTAAGKHGLVVPVIHQAQDLSLLGIAVQLQTLTEWARSGRLVQSDVKGGTFPISNHGTSGSLFAAPIIVNQPQSAILGVGALEKRVVVREVGGEDAIQIRPTYVLLTIDHRAIDGAQADMWLRQFVATINGWPNRSRAAGFRFTVMAKRVSKQHIDQSSDLRLICRTAFLPGICELH